MDQLIQTFISIISDKYKNYGKEMKLIEQLFKKNLVRGRLMEKQKYKTLQI